MASVRSGTCDRTKPTFQKMPSRSFSELDEINKTLTRECTLRSQTKMSLYRKKSEPIILMRRRRSSIKPSSVTCHLPPNANRRIQLKEKTVPEEPKPVSKKWTLRILAKTAIILRRMGVESIDKERKTDSNPFYSQMKSISSTETVDTSKEMLTDKKQYLSFNRADYKANTKLRMSNEAKRILTKRPELRTDEEIYHAMMALRGLKLIAEYPVRMQRNLAQYGYFESYGPKRIVVKEGRHPEGFYFIIYGKLLVAVMQGSGYAETMAELTAGHSFGELAIINRSTRQSSVITKTYTELFKISDEVYAKIFMVGGAKNINDPDQEQFLKSLNFLDGWPIKLFEKYDPKKFTFSFFRRNTVIVRDSNLSDWIFIVKSGSITVLKKLVKVRHSLSKTGIQVVKTNSDRYLDFINNDDHTSVYNLSQADQDVGYCDSAYDCFASLRYRPHTCCSSRPRVRRPGVHKSQSAGCTKRSRSDLLQKVNDGTSWPDFPLLKARYDSGRIHAFEDEENEDCKNIRTHIDDLNAAYNEKQHCFTHADINPEFVHVQSLTKGDVFGLPQMLFEDQPSLSLVSNGSECMVLNKKFFLDNCPQSLIITLKNEVSPYPSDSTLQANLQTMVNWEMYKTKLRHTMLAALPTHILS